jgi:quinoprotein glucose dehydrogenase
MILAITSAVIGILALGLVVLGGWLAYLGGSWAYVLLGLSLVVVAWLIARRRAAALHLYAVVLLAVLGWSLWEVGLDWWQLMPRGWLLVLLGIWLWLPLVRRRLTALPTNGPALALWNQEKWDRAASVPLGFAILCSGGVGVYTMLVVPPVADGQAGSESVVAEANLGAEFSEEDWHQYGRSPYGQRYSPLDQITAENIRQLEPAWIYQTGDVRQPGDVTETTYQVTPIKVGNTLYLCTPHNIAIALDAASGKEIWRFDANSGLNADRQHQTCRGVTYWRAPDAQDELCAERVFLPTADARLIALDAYTGRTCPNFGTDGTVQLETGMPFKPAGYYYSTSPPVAVNGKLIIGGAVNDNYSVKSPSGVIRAFDVDTGELVWNWDAGNPEQTEPIDVAAGETYTPNSPNSWSVFSVDPALGLVYIPLGNQVPDQLGMGRSAAVEAHSSSVVALDVATGQKRWVFQTVHHDLWDMDVPAQPVLIDMVTTEGAAVKALVQPTKQGDIYVLNRETGVPILPVTEEPAPRGAIAEDFTAPTQPTSALSFKPPMLQEADMWGLTLFDQLMCRIDYHRLAYEGRYTPPSVGGTIVHPGNFGVFNWGSVAVDPERMILFGMPTYLPFTVRLVPEAEIPPKEAGAKASEQGLNRNEGAPYGVVMGPFLGPLQVPCSAPPWGYVAAADLRTGEVIWQRRNGTVRDMTPLPLPFELGVPGIGGPILTKGGVAFLGAAVDDYLRGYDVTTGAEIWRARLPAGGQSTPMTYAVDGKQFVLIVAGGHGSVGTKVGDYVLAYALGDKGRAP